MVQLPGGMSSEGARRVAEREVERELFGAQGGGSGGKEGRMPVTPNRAKFEDILVQIYPGGTQKVRNNLMGRRNLETLLQVSSVDKTIVPEGQPGPNHDNRGNFDYGFLKNTDMTKMSQHFPSKYFLFVKN